MTDGHRLPVDLTTDRKYSAALKELEELRDQRAAADAELQERRAELQGRNEVVTISRLRRLHAQIEALERRLRTLDRKIGRQEATVRTAREAASQRALARIAPELARLAEAVYARGRELAEAVAAEQGAREQLHRAGLDVRTLPYAAAGFPWFQAPFNAALLERISLRTTKR